MVRRAAYEMFTCLSNDETVLTELAIQYGAAFVMIHRAHTNRWEPIGVALPAQKLS